MIGLCCYALLFWGYSKWNSNKIDRFPSQINERTRIRTLACHLADGFERTNIDYTELNRKREELDESIKKMEVEERESTEIIVNFPNANRLLMFLAKQIITTAKTYAPHMALHLSTLPEYKAEIYYLMNCKDGGCFDLFSQEEKQKIESYLERHEIILYYASYLITVGHEHLVNLIFTESNPIIESDPIDDSLLLGRIESNFSQAENDLRDFLSYRIEQINKENSKKEIGSLSPIIFFLTNSLISPQVDSLVYWLLHQEKESVSVLELYETALNIYVDAWTAIAAIATLTHNDVVGTDKRNKRSLLVGKMKTPFGVVSEDTYGYIYHFWGYLFHTLRGQKPLILHSLSKGYEAIAPLMKNERPDWSDLRADRLGIRVGRALNKAIRNPKRCD